MVLLHQSEFNNQLEAETLSSQCKNFTPLCFDVEFFQGNEMPKFTVSRPMLLFWIFLIVLCSSISTTVFSESAFNDHFALTTMTIAIIGLVSSTSVLLVNLVHAICNPE